jgi:hypothetical protein
MGHKINNKNYPIMVQPRKPSSLMEKAQTAMISIATTGIIALCGFAINTRESLARIEQKQSSDDVIMNNQQTSINNMALGINKITLDVSDLQIRAARIEEKQNLKPR